MTTAIDNFNRNESGLSSPASHAALVTPDDANDLTYTTRGICLGGAGAIKVTMQGGETLVIPSGALAVGCIHPLRVSRIWNTSTTATSIVAVW